MFTVTAICPPGWVWTAVTLTAVEDMHATREILGWDSLRAPRLEHWRLDVAKGRDLLLNIPRERPVELGDVFDIKDVADCFDLRADWKMVDG